MGGGGVRTFSYPISVIFCKAGPLMCPPESITRILNTAGGETGNISSQTSVPNDLNICFHILEDKR